MKKRRGPQDYSPEEFDAVVDLIRSDQGLREDIEAITGQSLTDKTARELFNLFHAIKQANEVQEAVVNFGRARQAVRRTRAVLAEAALEDLPPSDPAAKRIAELEARIDEVKTANARLKESNIALTSGRVHPIAGRVIKGQVEGQVEGKVAQ